MFLAVNSINQYWPNMITYYCYNGWNDDYKISLVVWNGFNLFLICCTIFCNIWRYNPYFQKQYFLNTTLFIYPVVSQYFGAKSILVIVLIQFVMLIIVAIFLVIFVVLILPFSKIYLLLHICSALGNRHSSLFCYQSYLP